jgi:hypothetical protein
MKRSAISLWNCPSAKDVWSECPLKISKCTSDDGDFIDIVAKLLERLETEQLQFMAVVARQIWLKAKFLCVWGEYGRSKYY